MVDLNQLARECYGIAAAKGFHDQDNDLSQREKVAVAAANLHSEVSDLWEAYRLGRLDAPCDKATRMRELGLVPITNVEEELADVLIRVFDTAVMLGIDISNAVSVKMAYIAARAHRNGGKLA